MGLRHLLLSAALLALSCGHQRTAFVYYDLTSGAEVCGLDLAAGDFAPDDVDGCYQLSERSERRDGDKLIVTLADPTKPEHEPRAVRAAELGLERELAVWLRTQTIAATTEDWKALAPGEQRLLRHLLAWPEGATPADGLYLGSELFGDQPEP